MKNNLNREVFREAQEVHAQTFDLKAWRCHQDAEHFKNYLINNSFSSKHSSSNQYIQITFSDDVRFMIKQKNDFDDVKENSDENEQKDDDENAV